MFANAAAMGSGFAKITDAMLRQDTELFATGIWTCLGVVLACSG
jgi:hypothetical protein